MIELLTAQYVSTLKDVREAVGDVEPALMAQPFGGCVNHPAWTLGHLCVAAEFALALLGEPVEPFVERAQARFGPGSKPVADASAYPEKAELVAALKERHRLLDAAARARHGSHFGLPAPESVRAFASTVGQVVFYLMAAHEPYHLGQLMHWRRGAGLAKG